MVVAPETSQAEMSWLKEVPANIPRILVTEETSQLSRGWLKEVAS